MAQATAAPDVKKAYGRKKKRKRMTLADIHTSADSTRAMDEFKEYRRKEYRAASEARRKRGAEPLTKKDIDEMAEHSAKHSLRGKDLQKRIHRTLQRRRKDRKTHVVP